MIFKPTKFQQSKISEISTKVTQSLLQNIDKKVIVLKAPTGSGKTFMLSEAIKTISNTLNDNPQVSYIWIAPRKLHDQSKLKLESYFSNEEYIKCSFFTEISIEGIKANEILFLNWESINKINKNTIIRENEEEFYFDNVPSGTYLVRQIAPPQCIQLFPGLNGSFILYENNNVITTDLNGNIIINYLCLI